MIRVDIKDSGLAIDAVRTAIKTARERGVLSAAQRLVQVIQTDLIPNAVPPPVDQGAYKAGWDAEPTATGADVFNTAPHAPEIEWGVRASNIKPGRAMVNAIAEWATRKGLLGRGRGSIQERAQGAEAQSMAWAIVTNMKKRGIFNRDGTEGLHILDKARARLPKLLEQEIHAELAELLAKK